MVSSGAESPWIRSIVRGESASVSGRSGRRAGAIGDRLAVSAMDCGPESMVSSWEIDCMIFRWARTMSDGDPLNPRSPHASNKPSFAIA